MRPRPVGALQEDVEHPGAQLRRVALPAARAGFRGPRGSCNCAEGGHGRRSGAPPRSGARAVPPAGPPILLPADRGRVPADARPATRSARGLAWDRATARGPPRRRRPTVSGRHAAEASACRTSWGSGVLRWSRESSQPASTANSRSAVAALARLDEVVREARRSPAARRSPPRTGASLASRAAGQVLGPARTASTTTARFSRVSELSAAAEM